jgi:hypothetical protein
MQNISDYINEDSFPVSFEIEYTPQNRKELIDAIVEVAKAQSRRKVLDFNCIDTSVVTNMGRLFLTAGGKVNDIFKKDFLCDQWDVSNVKDFNNMFALCTGFTGKGLENWNVTDKCRYAHMMFERSGVRRVDMSKWDLLNVVDISLMFSYCDDLQEVRFPSEMNKLQVMQSVFDNARGLKEVVLPEHTGEIKTLLGCFMCAGTNQFKIYNLAELKCSKETGMLMMFAHSKPRLIDIIEFVEANDLASYDLEDLHLEDSLMSKIEDALNKRS